MESFPWPNIGIGSGWALVAFFVWQLYTGRAASGREIREKNATIARLEKQVSVRDHQLSLVLTEAMTTLSPVLKAVRAAVDAEEDEGLEK